MRARTTTSRLTPLISHLISAVIGLAIAAHASAAMQPPVNVTPESAAQGSTWSLVAPAVPTSSPISALLVGRRDASLMGAPANAAFPLGAWPEERVPQLERFRTISTGRSFERFWFFRRAR